MPKIEWLALKADELQQPAKQTNHANSGALKQRQYSFCSGIHITRALTHTMQISARQQRLSAWKESLLLGTFSGFLDVVAFLMLPSPFWSFWKNKFTGAQPPSFTGPQKAATAKDWNALDDNLFSF